MSTARPVGRTTRTGGGPVGGLTSTMRCTLHVPAAAASRGRASVPTPTGTAISVSVIIAAQAGSGRVTGGGGDFGPSLRRFAGGGGGVAMAAIRRAISRSPRCTTVPTRGTITISFPGVGGRSRGGCDSSSEISDISPNNSFNFDFRSFIVEAFEKLWAVVRPLSLYRSLGQGYVSGLVNTYTHTFSNQRVSTSVVFFFFGVIYGFPISGSPLQWFFFLTVSILSSQSAGLHSSGSSFLRCWFWCVFQILDVDMMVPSSSRISQVDYYR